MLLELALAADAVHDLEVLLALGDVGDEVEEVVGLPVEAERVERPQHERRVADPAVAVVPVALAARRLGQRRRGRREQRAARGVGEPLQRERAALQERPPRVIGEAPAVKPVLPMMGGPHEPAVGLLEVLRGRVLAPGQRAVDLLALLHPVASRRPRPLEPEAQVGRQPELDVRALGRGHALVVAAVAVLPVGRLAPVVEHRLAVEHHLDLAVDAADRPQQDVIGVVVGGGAPVRVRALVLVVPVPISSTSRTMIQPATGAPARLEHHRARQVPARGRDGDAGGAEPERARVAVEHRAEHARRVDAGQAQPFDVAARRDQRDRLAVGQKAVVGDRRKRAAAERNVGRQMTHRRLAALGRRQLPVPVG